MPFKVSITEDAARQFRSLPTREQRTLEVTVSSAKDIELSLTR
jgi:hypothetical protein